MDLPLRRSEIKIRANVCPTRKVSSFPPHVTAHMQLACPKKLPNPQTSARILQRNFRCTSSNLLPQLTVPPPSPDDHTARPENEVPQGRPSRHHHPRPICRQEGTILVYAEEESRREDKKTRRREDDEEAHPGIIRGFQKTMCTTADMRFDLSGQLCVERKAVQ